jgi:hypothetical protein
LATLGGPEDPPGLHGLELECGLSPEHLRALAASPVAPRLTDLTLFNTGLGVDELTVLVGEPAFAGLRRLRLHHNFGFPTGREALAVLAGPDVLPGLTDLSLSTNLLWIKTAPPLAAAPLLARLVRLELGTNLLEAKGLRLFLEAPDRPRMTYLGLSRNALRDQGAEMLAAWPGLSRFRRLDLGGNFVSAAFVERLARDGLLDGIDRIRLIDPPSRDSSQMPWLLNLISNFISEAGVLALLRSPHRRARLAELDLSSESLAPELARLRDFFEGDGRVC